MDSDDSAIDIEKDTNETIASLETEVEADSNTEVGEVKLPEVEAQPEHEVVAAAAAAAVAAADYIFSQNSKFSFFWPAHFEG